MSLLRRRKAENWQRLVLELAAHVASGAAEPASPPAPESLASRVPLILKRPKIHQATAAALVKAALDGPDTERAEAIGRAATVSRESRARSLCVFTWCPPCG